MKTLEKYLSWSIIGLLFATVLMPLIVTYNFYFPYVSGKGFYFRILVEISAVLYLFLIALFPQWRPRKNILWWFFGALLILLLLSNILGKNAYSSFLSNYERMEGYINIIHLVIFAVITHSMFAGKRLWNYLFGSSLFISSIISVYSFLQLAGFITINQGGVRIDGTFGNASYLAAYALIHIFLALYFVFKRELNLTARILASIAAFFNLIVLYNTQTRGAILGLLGGLFVSFIIIAIWGKNNYFKKVSIYLLVTLLLLISGFLLVKDSQFVQQNATLNRFANISLNDSTTQSRFTIWGMAIEGIKEKPLLGWGQENFSYVFDKYYKPSLFNQEPWFDRTHNIVLDWLVAGGVLGGLAYLSLFPLSIYLIWKKEDFELTEKAIWTGLICAYFFQNLFVFDNPTSYMLFFVFLAFLSHENKEEEAGDFNINILNQAGLAVLIATMVYSSYVFTIKPMVASDNLIEGLQSYQVFRDKNLVIADMQKNEQNAALTRAQIPAILSNPDLPEELKNIFRKLPDGPLDQKLIEILSGSSKNDVDIMIDKLKNVIDLKTFGSAEAREQIITLAPGILQNQNFPQFEKNDYISFARAQMTLHVAEAPESARRNILVGGTYRQLGDTERAIEYVKNAIDVSPTKQTLYLELGNIYMQIDEKEKVLENWQMAYRLDESFVQTKLAYIGGLYFADKDTDARLMVEQIVNQGNEAKEKLAIEEIEKNKKEIDLLETKENLGADEKQRLELLKMEIRETEESLENIPADEIERLRKNYSDYRAFLSSDSIINILTRAEKYEELKYIWEIRVEGDSDNIKYLISLAATNYEIGDTEKAIEIIEKAMEINPDFKETGESYIEDIRAGRRPQ